jgi:sodium-dependent phosphate cotransporter
MIMGANIGTTVTNTIVSLGHIGHPTEFRRAFSAATCHDFFNFLTVAILLPLEMATGFLQSMSGTFASLVTPGTGTKLPNPIKDATKAAAGPLQDAVEAVFGVGKGGAVALIVVSALVIFVALLLIVKNLRTLSGGRLQSAVARALDSSSYIGILVGIVVTVMVQSSSITTSVLVPLAGAGVVTLRQVFPVTIGANIGTTLTAILASMATPEATAHLAVQIAIVHLLFNIFGLLLIYPIPAIREVPLALARKLADLAVRSRGMALLYVAGLFYGLPAALIFLVQ